MHVEWTVVFLSGKIVARAEKHLREEKSWDEKSKYSIELFTQYVKGGRNQEFIPSLRDFYHEVVSSLYAVAYFEFGWNFWDFFFLFL